MVRPVSLFLPSLSVASRQGTWADAGPTFCFTLSPLGRGLVVVSRTGDGRSLIVTSSDGYASVFSFEEGELGTRCPDEVQPGAAAAAAAAAGTRGLSVFESKLPSFGTGGNGTEQSASAVAGAVHQLSPDKVSQQQGQPTTAQQTNGQPDIVVIGSSPAHAAPQAGPSRPDGPAKRPFADGGADEDEEVVFVVEKDAGVTGTLAGDKQAQAQGTDGKKVKKRAALTFVGALGAGPA